MNDASEAWVEHLLCIAEERVEGKPLTDAEAQAAHEWAFAQAWELEQEDDWFVEAVRAGMTKERAK